MFIVDSYDIAVAFCLIACAMSRLDCVRGGGKVRIGRSARAERNYSLNILLGGILFTAINIPLSAAGAYSELHAVPGPKVLYIDSETGNDAADGMSPASAWESFCNIRKGTLYPGDTVRIRRGSSFSETLMIEDSGTAREPIVVTDYGGSDSPAPSFTNTCFDPENGSYGNCIRVEGSHVIIENMYCHHTVANLPEDTGGGFPVMWELGAIHIARGADSCTVRNNEIFDCGVGIKSNGEHALIENNYIHDCNRVLKRWNWGPIGIWLGADWQEVSRNTVINYSAVNPNIGWGPDGYCSGADGGAIEIDDARFPKSHIEIHHNYTRDCQGFMEVTWTDVKKNPDYRNFHVHHNVSDDYQAFAALWRGAGCLFENNTIIRRKINPVEWGVFNITQNNSKNRILNNIIVTAKGVRIFLTGQKNRAVPNSVIDGNVYWCTDGYPSYGYDGPGTNFILADPCFVNLEDATVREHLSLGKDSPIRQMDKGAIKP